MRMEWETDNLGRRFRKVGSCIEYEPTVTIDGIEIPQSEVESFNQMRREALEKMKRETALDQESHSCPFHDGLSTNCDHKCALYVEGACTLPQLITGTPLVDTKGKSCPIRRSSLKCADSCILYRNGCILTAIKRGE